MASMEDYSWGVGYDDDDDDDDDGEHERSAVIFDNKSSSTDGWVEEVVKQVPPPHFEVTNLGPWDFTLSKEKAEAKWQRLLGEEATAFEEDRWQKSPLMIHHNDPVT